MNDLEDVFAPLENAVQQQDMEQRAARLLIRCRSYLLLGRRFDGDVQSREAMASTVFFSTIAMRMEPVPTWTIPTMATDGKRLLYNPKFLLDLGIDQGIGVVVHETMHIAMKHHCRLGTRNMKRANIAADLAINWLLVQSGFRLPSCALLPGKRPENCPDQALSDAIFQAPPNLSMEEYYSLLPDPPQGGEGEGEGEGDGESEGQDPGGCGGIQRPGDGSPSAARQAEAEAEVLVVQAHQAAKQRGTLSAGLERLVVQALKPSVDWRHALRDFLNRKVRNDYSWTRCNRRYISQGLHLPGMDGEELGEIVVAVDTSGSINDRILAQFAGELQSILDCFSVKLTVLYHDSEICHVQCWQSSDGPLVLEWKGGGGTSHVPVFDWIDKQETPPTALICLTDMESRFPSAAPAYPVLWASTTRGHSAPFGDLVEVTVNA